jgi:hypothetical protein
VAIAFKEWISCVIQTIDPWVSSEDIEKGDRWFSDVSQKLENVILILVQKLDLKRSFLSLSRCHRTNA